MKRYYFLLVLIFMMFVFLVVALFVGAKGSDEYFLEYNSSEVLRK